MRVLRFQTGGRHQISPASLREAFKVNMHSRHAKTLPIKLHDRVWHAALWATMKKYNISTNLIQVIKNFYNKAISAVLFNGSTGDWFRTTVGVQQGCLLSPTLFNIFLERITTDA